MGAAMGVPPRVAVIGAGAAGLAAVKALRDAGVPAVGFESADQVGGLWVYGAPDSPAYRTLHLNTSRGRTQFADHPMPTDWPDYPDHRRVAGYLADYADRFGLGDDDPAAPHRRAGHPGPGRHLDGDRRRPGRAGRGHRRRRGRRQRAQPGAPAARPAVPRHLHRRADAQPRLPGPGAVGRQAGPGRRRRQLRDGHRRGRLVRRHPHPAVAAPGRLGGAEVPARPPLGHPQRGAGPPAAVAAAPAHQPDDAAAPPSAAPPATGCPRRRTASCRTTRRSPTGCCPG